MRACDACLRRARLIARLAGHLDHLHAKRGMLDEVFALSDEDLVAALVPSRRDRRRMLSPGAVGEEASRAAGLAATCRHDGAYPAALRDLPGAPAALRRVCAAGAEGALGITGDQRKLYSSPGPWRWA